jgi:hypothetical protein
MVTPTLCWPDGDSFAGGGAASPEPATDFVTHG